MTTPLRAFKRAIFSVYSLPHILKFAGRDVKDAEHKIKQLKEKLAD